MIRISYNDFMPNSGNVSLDSVQDKLVTILFSALTRIATQHIFAP